jgi:TolB-like protein/tetratricopeptide (TPR) repeat protein
MPSTCLNMPPDAFCVGELEENHEEGDQNLSLTGAVFLSYASGDAAAAERIATGLRAAGIEVWFDQSELRGGDAWDTSIRKQIKTCALFIPVISHTTHDRVEGYFRLEWKLAVDRSHLIAADQAFLLPVVIDETRDDDERVPERFREVQWTRLSGGVTSAAFVERVRRLLSGESSPGPIEPKSAAAHGTAAPATRKPLLPWWRSKVALLTTIAVIVVALGYVTANRLVPSRRGAEVAVAPAPAAESAPLSATAFNPPPHSIAVLPFADLSEKRDQEYFSDGLAEELLDLLTKTRELQVTARTSSFYYKGKQVTVPDIARTLRVAHVLEGSVRKSGNAVRVTTELIRARDGVRLWSETYDRNLDDVFRVQNDIAAAVVKALRIRLLPSEQPVNQPRAANSEAYYQYLLGKGMRSRGMDGWPLALQAFRKSIALDPGYAPAYARLALAENFVADRTNDAAGFRRAVDAAERAVALAPGIPDGYTARAFMRYTILWDWKGAGDDLDKALTLEPNNAMVQGSYGDLMYTLGRLPEAIAATQKSIEGDPLSASTWVSLGLYLYSSGDMPGARHALDRSFEINPDNTFIRWHLGVLELLDAQPQKALAHFQQVKQPELRLDGIAISEHTLGHAKESQTALDELIKSLSLEAAAQIAEVYAWRGEKDKAFEWLNRAYEQRDGGISDVKSNPLLASLRTDPRYQAFLRKMQLPL